MTSAATFTAAGLGDDEARLLAHHIRTIETRLARNKRLDVYYEGQNRVRDLGIAIPPGLSAVETVVGWPTMAVDVLEERLDIEDVVVAGGDGDELGLRDIWRANRLQVESGLAHTDTLIYGLNFVAASIGDTAALEPNPLITVEPPTRMTGTWDARLGRLMDAASVQRSEEGDRYTGASLYLPDASFFLDCDGDRWTVRDVQEHGLGRVPVARLVNRPRSGRPWGTSQISRAIISYTDTAVRTLLGMEVAREFYSSPQRYALGADEKLFMDPQGNPKTAWEVYLGRFLALPFDDEGNKPEIGQLSAASPAPYLEQIKGLASLVSAEAGIPIAYMGFNTDNPPSADAIRSLEARLVKAAERRQTVFGMAWAEVMRLAILQRDGELPPEADRIAVVWRDAATPTRAAAADRVQKLIAAGVLQPDSEVTYEELGFSGVDKARLVADARRARTTQRITALTSGAGAALADPIVSELARQASDAVTTSAG